MKSPTIVLHASRTSASCKRRHRETDSAENNKNLLCPIWSMKHWKHDAHDLHHCGTSHDVGESDAINALILKFLTNVFMRRCLPLRGGDEAVFAGSEPGSKRVWLESSLSAW